MRVERFVLDGAVPGEIRVPDEESTSSDRPAVVVAGDLLAHRGSSFHPYVAERLARSGFLTVTHDPPGAPRPVNDPADDLPARFARETLTDRCEVLHRVVTALFEHELPFPDEVDHRRIGLLGHRTGASLALDEAADDERIRALALWAPPRSPADALAGALRDRTLETRVDGRTLRKGRVFFRDLARWDDARMRASAADLEIPWLVVQGQPREANGPTPGARLAGLSPDLSSYLPVPGSGPTFGVTDPFTGTTEALEAVLQGTVAFLEEEL